MEGQKERHSSFRFWPDRDEAADGFRAAGQIFT
jgi:hypothetical protein